MEERYKGDEIGKITTIKQFKTIMVDLFRGYPAYEYFGIFESIFGKELGEKIIKILKKDNLIEVVQEERKELTKYRLSAEGINFAISMINLDYSEKTINLSKNVVIISWALLGVALVQLSLLLFQIFIMVKIG